LSSANDRRTGLFIAQRQLGPQLIFAKDMRMQIAD
jgi:hypothetical protein